MDAIVIVRKNNNFINNKSNNMIKFIYTLIIIIFGLYSANSQIMTQALVPDNNLKKLDAQNFNALGYYGNERKWSVAIQQTYGTHMFPKQREANSTRVLATPVGILPVNLTSKYNYLHFLNLKLNNDGNTGNTLCEYSTSAYDTELHISNENISWVLGHHNRTFNHFYYTNQPSFSDYSESNTINSFSIGFRKKIYGALYAGLDGEYSYSHKRKDNVGGLVAEYTYRPNESLNLFNAMAFLGFDAFGFDLYLKYLIFNPFNKNFIDDLGSKPFANREAGKFFWQLGKRFYIANKPEVENNEQRQQGYNVSFFGIATTLTVPHYFPLARNSTTPKYTINTPNGNVDISMSDRDPLVTPVTWVNIWNNLSLIYTNSNEDISHTFALSHLDLSQTTGAYPLSSNNDSYVSVNNKALSWGFFYDINFNRLAGLGLGVRYANIYKFEQSQFIGDQNFDNYASFIPTTHHTHNFILRLSLPYKIFTGTLNYMPRNYLKSEVPIYNNHIIWFSMDFALGVHFSN